MSTHATEHHMDTTPHFTQNGFLAYKEAMTSKNADIDALQDIVINYGTGQDVYHFAKDVKGADIQALQQAVIERGDSRSAYHFARYIKDADIQALQDVVTRSGELDIITLFALYVEGSNLDALQDALINGENDPRQGEYAYYLASRLDNTDIEKLQEVVIKKGPGWVTCAFADNVTGADVLRLQEAILENGQPSDMFALARDVDGAELSKIRSRLVQLKDTQQDDGYLYRFDTSPTIAERIQRNKQNVKPF